MYYNVDFLTKYVSKKNADPCVYRSNGFPLKTYRFRSYYLFFFFFGHFKTFQLRITYIVSETLIRNKTGVNVKSCVDTFVFFNAYLVGV